MISWIIFGSPFANILALFLFCIEMYCTFAAVVTLLAISPITKSGREYEKECIIRSKFIEFAAQECGTAVFFAKIYTQARGEYPVSSNNNYYKDICRGMTGESYYKCRQLAEEWYEQREAEKKQNQVSDHASNNVD